MAPPIYSRAQWESVLRKTRDALTKDPKNAAAKKWYGMAHDALSTLRENENAREAMQAQDPGGLIAAGLGAADYASFGLGPQIAKSLDRLATHETSPETSAVYDAAAAQHPLAYNLVGGAIGTLPTFFAPTTPGKVLTGIRAIKNPIVRGLAKLGYNTGVGAAFGGAQAGGHAEGDIGDRLQAAKTGATVGGALALGGTIIGNTGSLLGNKFGAPVLKRIAGKYVPRAAATAAEAPAPTETLEEAAARSLGIRVDQLGKLGQQAVGLPPEPPVYSQTMPAFPSAPQGTSQAQGIAVEGVRAMPKAPTTQSVLHRNPFRELLDAIRGQAPTSEAAIATSESADVLAARARVIRKLGFPASDAEIMARQGTQVPRIDIERILGRRLPGTTKWY